MIGFWRDRPWLWRWGLVLASISSIRLIARASSIRLISIEFFICITCLALGVIFLAVTWGKPKNELPPGKLGIWENRPTGWKVGLIIALLPIVYILNLLFGVRADGLISYIFIEVLGIILMVDNNNRKIKKPIFKKSYNKRPLAWRIGILMLIFSILYIIVSLIIGADTDYMAFIVFGGIGSTLIITSPE